MRHAAARPHRDAVYNLDPGSLRESLGLDLFTGVSDYYHMWTYVL
jgi:hypothetical protein